MMQEDIENKTVNLAVTTSKVTSKAICQGIKMFLANRKNPKAKHGRQRVKQLLRQQQAISKMPLDNENIREFAKLAKKYGVDFAVTKDRSKRPPIYTIFFKAKDTEALQHIADTLVKRQMEKKNRKPSIISQLAKLRGIIRDNPHKERRREQEHIL